MTDKDETPGHDTPPAQEGGDPWAEVTDPIPGVSSETPAVPSRPDGDPWAEVTDRIDGVSAGTPAAPREPEGDPWAEVTDRVGRPPAPRAEREVLRAPGPDPLASVAEEARRFLGSLQDRAFREVRRGVAEGTMRGTVAGIGQVFGGGARRGDVWEEAVTAHDDDGYICRACPVCRAIAARREPGAGVTDHLMAAGGELFSAVREVFDTLSRPAPPRRPRDDRPDAKQIDQG